MNQLFWVLELLHRSKRTDNAEQNKLEKNTWVDIYFNGDLPINNRNNNK